MRYRNGCYFHNYLYQAKNRPCTSVQFYEILHHFDDVSKQDEIKTVLPKKNLKRNLQNLER